MCSDVLRLAGKVWSEIEEKIYIINMYLMQKY